jgi:hypothetical protein
MTAPRFVRAAGNGSAHHRVLAALDADGGLWVMGSGERSWTRLTLPPHGATPFADVTFIDTTTIACTDTEGRIWARDARVADNERLRMRNVWGQIPGDRGPDNQAEGAGL